MVKLCASALADLTPATRFALGTLSTTFTAAFNVISQDGVSWVFPRRGNEIPEPHFGFALGAAEIWGRWFFPEEEPFRAATARDLEQAIAQVGFPRE